MGKPGSFLSSTRRPRGGGRGARLGGVERGGGIQREMEWGQEVAGVPRAAVEQREVASGPPQWQAVLHCAGSRAKQRGREVGDDCWTCL